MAASASSNVAAAKPPHLSYADRARRAGASMDPKGTQRARPAGPNGRTRSGDESTSPASSSRNLTPNSSAALTLPGSPPPSSSQTSADEQQSFPPIPKSSSKMSVTNVWTARTEQRARAAGQGFEHASTAAAAEPSSQQASNAALRSQPNRINLESTTIEEHDPFVVRVPPHVQERANASSASQTPPSLDDAVNWPEMGKSASSASPSVSGSVIDTDKKEGPSRKGEKTNWVRIPPEELRKAHDDNIAAQAAANPHVHSHYRRGNQQKSRSRQQSQARSTRHQSQSQNRGRNQGQNYGPALSNGSASGQRTSEGLTTHSRPESTSHSQTTSVHSSPRHAIRGRRLPDEQTIAVNSDINADTGPSTAMRDLSNGVIGSEEQVTIPLPPDSQSGPPPQQIYQDSTSGFGNAPPAPHSGPHSQSQSPYSHSPVYYPTPPPNSALQGYSYGPLPPTGGYPVPPPVPSPSNGGGPMQQPGFIGYAPYGFPQHLPPGQPPFPYMYQPVTFPYYPTHVPGQQPEQQDQRRQGVSHEGELNEVHLSPLLPLPSTRTRPPPPDKSEPLSGYRNIAPVPVSPLLNASAPRQSISEVTEGSNEMVFGSLGQPDGLKSPSPAAVLSSVREDEQERKGTLTSFAVGFEGSATIRIKRTASGKDGVDEVADAIKVIDLTDRGSKWEFGTSTQPDTESPQNESGERRQQPVSFEQEQATQQQMDPQILQPQPHHMLHYPPTNAPQPFQFGGYNVGPQVQLHFATIPMQSQSPQNNVQPPPSHVPSLAPVPLNPGFVSPLNLSSPGPGPQSSGPVPMMSGIPGSDEWEVRDFGYGFGQMSAGLYVSERVREDRYERENYRDTRDNYREAREFGGASGGGFGPGRIRRSTTTGGYGSGYFEGGRGGFGGRRGRGQNGFGRGFSRGGFGGRGGHGNFQRHQPSLSVATTSYQPQASMQQQPQQQISPDVPNPNGYFPSPTTAASQYIASPFGQFNPAFPPPQTHPQAHTQSVQQAQPPPVPMPVTSLSFPLDPTRLYLLGQLEYYFSRQNLASDLYLRQQMDSKGWIPISLIASFNRVRQMTQAQDPQLVKEVLGISSLVEVRDDHVRLSNRQWESFVLPGAAPSQVESEDASTPHPAPIEEGEKEIEETEEDDVVFILGGEGSRPWTGAN